MSNAEVTQQVSAREQQLQKAMLGSDVDALDDLIADELSFTTHLGIVVSKADDLKAHGSGLIHIDSIERAKENVQVLGPHAAVVTVEVKIAGTFAGKPSNGTFRFLRVWQREADDAPFRIIIGQATAVRPPPTS